MKLAISNIAFGAESDDYFYNQLEKMGVCGLEIAPTRIFPESPYDKLYEAKKFSEKLHEKYSLEIVSMQSIWYGITQKIFATDEERQILINYTKKAVNFAEIIGCKNLVFGCPKNRVIESENQYETAVDFFKIIGDYAYSHGTIIAIEANPPIYNTNFINNDEQAKKLCLDVSSDGFKINLDMGTMIYNDEKPDDMDFSLISHIHLSEPGLGSIEKRELHKALSDKIKSDNYKGYVSLEMKKGIENERILEILRYAKDVFN